MPTRGRPWAARRLRLRVRPSDVGRGGGGGDGRKGAVGTRVVPLVPGVPPLVDAHVAALGAAEVAEGALVGLGPRVGPLMHLHLQEGRRTTRQGATAETIQ